MRYGLRHSSGAFGPFVNYMISSALQHPNSEESFEMSLGQDLQMLLEPLSGSVWMSTFQSSGKNQQSSWMLYQNVFKESPSYFSIVLDIE